MAWYGWLLLGVLSTVIGVLVYFLIKKKPDTTLTGGLVTALDTLREKESSIQKKLDSSIEEARIKFEASLKEVQDDYEKKITDITKEREERFVELVSNPDLIDQWIKGRIS